MAVDIIEENNSWSLREADTETLIYREGMVIPILATRNLVTFPDVMSAFAVGRKSTVELVSFMLSNEYDTFAIFCQKDPAIETPAFGDLLEYGVIATLERAEKIGGDADRYKVMVNPVCRCVIDRAETERPFLMASLTALPEYPASEDDKEFRDVVTDIWLKLKELKSRNYQLPDEMDSVLGNDIHGNHFVNIVSTCFPMTAQEKISLLSKAHIKVRALELKTLVDREMKYAILSEDIENNTRATIQEEQKEQFLRRQMDTIKRELGNGEDDVEIQNLLSQASEKKWHKNIREEFDNEVERLRRFHPSSPDYNVQLSYLKEVLRLPWGECSEDNLDLKRAEKILNRDHYGMEKVKERILEYIAVLKLRGDLKSPILCLYGPPGVGKTSLGKSIADSLNRKYVRMSLGGLHDESEIRGHRRTYIGAMPGRIMKSLAKAGTSNPVFILDEVDKITQNTHQGDPSSALLEVLDPEQNNAFHDNFINMDYDLSKVMFIATANDISTIPGPLRDRMEMIEVSGYTTEEKIEIAKRHLVPKEKDNTGLASEKGLTFRKNALETLIERYTRESGVRQLEKQINKVFRKFAMYKSRDGILPFEKITPEHLTDLIGKPPFYRDIYQGNDYAGVVTGLAWTSVGGEILFIETSLSKGKSGKLTLTGNLGDVMKESATIALEYVKAHAGKLGVDPKVFENWNIHIHVPEGATPKDGPSAGITIATSIASSLTQRKVRKNVAMTGEITLRGKVLPVGGIKEKILAAKRAGITDIMLCSANRKDIEEIPDMYLKGVAFHYVENVDDVWDFALTNEMVDNPLDMTVPEEASVNEKA